MENNCHCNESKCSLRSATTVKNFSIQENNLLVTSQQTGIVFLLAILQHIYLFTEMFQLDGWMTKRIYLSLKIIFVKLHSPLLSRKKRWKELYKSSCLHLLRFLIGVSNLWKHFHIHPVFQILCLPCIVYSNSRG